MFLTIFGTICVAILSYILFQWLHFQWTDKSWLYYAPRCKPFFGHILSLHDRKWFHQEKPNWYRNGNGTFVTQMFSKRIIITIDVTIWEALLSSQKYLDKGQGYWIFKKFLGNGLVTSSGDVWKKHRRMITPAFHFEILNEFVSIMENRTLELIEMLKKFHEKDESFNAFDITKPFSLSIICETSMGIDLTIDETNAGRFKAMFESLVQILFKRLLNPLYKNDWLYSQTKNGKSYYSTLTQLRGFVKEILEKRIEVRRNLDKAEEMKHTKRRIFIDTLLDSYEKGDIDLDGILDEVNTFVFAGYETTSTALAWTLYCLGRNQRIQDKLYKEIISFKKSGDLQIEDFKEMPYLDMVVKESLRLHPPVVRFGRQIKNGTILAGREFPDCGLVVDIPGMNRNPEVWENPLTFNPERFEDFELKGKRNPFLFVPFSAGPRNCIGQKFALSELKAAVFHLVKHLELISLQDESELIETMDLTHGCENGPMMKVKPRK
ncbi:cytochrome P450 4c21-like [Clytia hemisphaerica]|uniref:cytochrome P450 4c21-like n=1 Tax=Clytia hemisphaerica TaxID=252671 RepID=UPI0034D5EE5F